MEELKLHPEWRQAAEVIASRVANEGYGIIITHHDLHSLFDLPKIDADAKYTAAELNQRQFALLQCVENLKDYLLESCNIYLLNVRGIGYQVVSPPEQIDIAYRKGMKKIHQELIKTMKAQVCVIEELLSSEDHDRRIRNIERLAFLKGATRKKKIGQEPPVVLKAIEKK